MWFSIVLVAIFFAAALYSGAKKAKRQQALREQIIRDYAPDEIHFSPENKTAIGINFKRKAVVLYSAGYLGEYTFNQIASVEVLRDNTSITQTNRGSQAFGAAVGTVALGGLGAMLGGLTGSTRTKTSVNQIDLKLIVDCTKRPVYVISFFETTIKSGISQKDPRVKAAIEKIDRYHAHIVNAIRNEQNSQKLPEAKIEAPAIDLKLLKDLWEMKQAGALTDSEFEQAKARALSSTQGQRSLS